MLKRVMGKASFGTLQDATGRIQLFVTKDALGEAGYDAFKHWDLGDIVGAEGMLFKTRTGELSVRVVDAAPADQEPAPAARQVPRHGRPGAEVPAALRRPDHRRGRAPALRRAQQGDRIDPPLHGRARLRRGRDADAASDPGRRECEAVRDAPQRARPADVPAHRARALPEAADRRRLRARVRDQPELSQRGHLGPPQPRVHDDGVLRGVLEPPRPDGLHRGGAAPCRAPGDRLGQPRLRRQAGRPRRAVPPPDACATRWSRMPTSTRPRTRSTPACCAAGSRRSARKRRRTGSCPSCSSACSRRWSRSSSGSRPSSSTTRSRSRRSRARPTAIRR